MNIAVYCSSRPNLAEEFVETAKIVGEWIGRNGYSLIFGGVNAGIMHTVAESTHNAGGKVVGVIPRTFIPRAEKLNDSTIVTADLNERKAKMIEISDFFIVLPGGLGTIDEWISTLSEFTVIGDTTRRILVANINGIYDNMAKQIEETSNSPFARCEFSDISIIANDAEQLKAELEKFNNNRNNEK
jgi:uncharacterized protein (TIGR00730 family)